MKEQFPQSWKDQLETLGFDTFTEIQEQIFSPIYEGRKCPRDQSYWNG